MDTQNLWQIVLSDLQLQVSKPVFQTFLSQTKLLDITENTATIGCNQPMLINYLEKRCYQLIKKTLDDYTKKDMNLIFTINPNPSKKNIDGPLFNTVKIMQENPAFPLSSLRLSADYSFENFAVSSSNQMAHAAATAVAKTPGTSYNPLFLYGGVGVGKTHLMQAIGNFIVKHSPSAKLIYCTGEEFTNDIIEAIGNKTTVSFKKRYRRLNVFLIDDIQFIAGKNAVQEEFFHTFNAIQQNGGQIVLTSDKPPEEINKLEERLRSRFEGGLTIDIGQPDFELRCAILLIKIKQRGIKLSIDLAKLIAANIENTRKLDGVLMRIITEAQTNNLPIDSELIKKILGKTIKEMPKRNHVKPEQVLTTVSSYYNLKLSQIKGEKRDKKVSLPRQIIYYILRSELKMPLVEIGQILGGRDHTTIMHGVRKITELVSNDKQTNEDVLGIKEKLWG